MKWWVLFTFLHIDFTNQDTYYVGSGWVFSASFPEICQILCCTLKKNSKTNRNLHRQMPIKWFSFNWYLCCGSSQTRIREIIWRGTTRPRDLYLQPFEFFCICILYFVSSTVPKILYLYFGFSIFNNRGRGSPVESDSLY